jgi:hypothetical protein
MIVPLGGKKVMGWLVKTLAGAVVAGVGWRFGADAYEALKKRFSREPEEKEEEEESVESGAAAAQTDITDASGRRPSEVR